MSGGMCPHVFGAWCPHYTPTCSEDPSTGKCIHLPAFMISPFDDESVRELETARELFHPGKRGKERSET